MANFNLVEIPLNLIPRKEQNENVQQDIGDTLYFNDYPYIRSDV